MKMTTLKSVKSLCYRVLRGAPLTLRTRYRPPSSFSALFTGFVSGTILPPRLCGYVLENPIQIFTNLFYAYLVCQCCQGWRTQRLSLILVTSSKDNPVAFATISHGVPN